MVFHFESFSRFDNKNWDFNLLHYVGIQNSEYANAFINFFFFYTVIWLCGYDRGAKECILTYSKKMTAWESEEEVKG